MKIMLVFLTIPLICYCLQAYLLHLVQHCPRHRESVDPGRYQLPFQQVRVKTANRKILCGWLIPAPATATPAPGIVLLHGWGGNAATLLPLAPLLHQAGFCQLLLAARGHGASDADGYPSMVKFARDLEAGLDWLEARQEIDGSRLFVLGHSLGGAAALLVGSTRPDLAAIVSIAAFAHSIPVLRQKMSSYGIPYWPCGWWLLRLMQWHLGVTYDRIAPLHTMLQNRAPVLLIHGKRDNNVPVRDALALHARCQHSAAQLWLIPGADHLPLRQVRREGERLLSFLQPGNMARASGQAPPKST